MRTVDTHGSFEDAIAEASTQIQRLARHLRELIVDVYPHVVEVPWPNQRIVGYGVGPKKMSEHFCYIAAHSGHVNLGFYYGSDLPDPDHLLVGSGKRFRHVKCHSEEDVNRAKLRSLLKAAVKDREQVLAASSCILRILLSHLSGSVGMGGCRAVNFGSEGPQGRLADGRRGADRPLERSGSAVRFAFS